VSHIKTDVIIFHLITHLTTVREHVFFMEEMYLVKVPVYNFRESDKARETRIFPLTPKRIAKRPMTRSTVLSARRRLKIQASSFRGHSRLSISRRGILEKKRW